MQCFIILQIPKEAWDYGPSFVILAGIGVMAGFFMKWFAAQKAKQIDSEIKQKEAKDSLELEMRRDENKEKREAHHALLTELQEMKKNIAGQKMATDEGVFQLKEMNSGMSELRKDIKEIQAVQVDHGKMLRDHDMLLREHEKKISELREKS